MGKIVVGSHGEDVCGRDPSDSAQRTYRFGMALENAWEPVNRATEVGLREERCLRGVSSMVYGPREEGEPVAAASRIAQV